MLFEHTAKKDTPAPHVLGPLDRTPVTRAHTLCSSPKVFQLKYAELVCNYVGHSEDLPL